MQEYIQRAQAESVFSNFFTRKKQHMQSGETHNAPMPRARDIYDRAYFMLVPTDQQYDWEMVHLDKKGRIREIHGPIELKRLHIALARFTYNRRSKKDLEQHEEILTEFGLTDETFSKLDQIYTLSQSEGFKAQLRKSNGRYMDKAELALIESVRQDIAKITTELYPPARQYVSSETTPPTEEQPNVTATNEVLTYADLYEIPSIPAVPLPDHNAITEGFPLPSSVVIDPVEIHDGQTAPFKTTESSDVLEVRVLSPVLPSQTGNPFVSQISGTELATFNGTSMLDTTVPYRFVRTEKHGYSGVDPLAKPVPDLKDRLHDTRLKSNELLAKVIGDMEGRPVEVEELSNDPDVREKQLLQRIQQLQNALGNESQWKNMAQKTVGDLRKAIKLIEARHENEIQQAKALAGTQSVIIDNLVEDNQVLSERVSQLRLEIARLSGEDIEDEVETATKLSPSEVSTLEKIIRAAGVITVVAAPVAAINAKVHDANHINQPVIVGSVDPITPTAVNSLQRDGMSKPISKEELQAMLVAGKFNKNAGEKLFALLAVPARENQPKSIEEILTVIWPEFKLAHDPQMTVGEALKKYSDYFTQLPLSSEQLRSRLTDLPNGAVVTDKAGSVLGVVGTKVTGERMIVNTKEEDLEAYLATFTGNIQVFIPSKEPVVPPQKTESKVVESTGIIQPKDVVLGLPADKVPTSYKGKELKTAADYEAAIQDQFGWTYKGFNASEMKMYWQLMWGMSNTNIPEKLKGYVIEKGESSYQESSMHSYIKSYPNQQVAHDVSLHEIGHAYMNKFVGFARYKQAVGSNPGYISYAGSGAIDFDYKGMTHEQSVMSEDMAEAFAQVLGALIPAYGDPSVFINQFYGKNGIMNEQLWKFFVSELGLKGAPAKEAVKEDSRISSTVITGGVFYPADPENMFGETSFSIANPQYYLIHTWDEALKQEVGIHPGVDMIVPANTKLYSAVEGDVVAAEWNDAWGNYVVVQSGTRLVRYMHMNSLSVKPGQHVDAGTFVGLSGGTGTAATGPHLHLDIKDTTVNDKVTGQFIDPASVINFAKEAHVDVNTQINTKDTPIFGEATVTKEHFIAILQRNNSPLYAEGTAGDVYDYFASLGINPAIYLGFFQVESRMGTDTASVSLTETSSGKITHNSGHIRWGNPTTYNTDLDTVNKLAQFMGKIKKVSFTRFVTSGNGDFRAYDSWADSAKDWANLLVLYSNSWGRGDTLQQAIPGAYAPANDNNDPHGYVATIVDLITKWLKEETGSSYWTNQTAGKLLDFFTKQQS